MQVGAATALGKVLVTGGTGFIGSFLVKRLVDEGNHVRVFDNNFRGNKSRLEPCLDKVEYVEGDVVNFDEVRRACEGVDTVFHLAAVNGTENFYKFPGKVLEVGVKGALNTLDAAGHCGVKRYIVTSSSEVYQEPTHLPTTETERIVIPEIKNPRFSYSGTKIITELLTLHYSDANGLSTVVCRPHNFYGPDMGLEHVMPQLILRMKELSDNFSQREIELPIQGTGEETRAFCFIEDAVDGLILCALNGENKEIYHIGTEEEITIRHLTKRIAEVLGLTIHVKTGERPLGGTTRRCPSIAKIRRLGFEPRWSLQRGLERTVSWYRDDHSKADNIGNKHTG